MECEENTFKVYSDNFYSLTLYSIIEKFTVAVFFAHRTMNLSGPSHPSDDRTHIKITLLQKTSSTSYLIVLLFSVFNENQGSKVDYEIRTSPSRRTKTKNISKKKSRRRDVRHRNSL
jgi:hypothetical protein